MKNTLFETMNFSTCQDKAPDRAIFFNKKKDINYYETLCFYCADNDIDLKNVSEDDFVLCVTTLENFPNNFYFWID